MRCEQVDAGPLDAAWKAGTLSREEYFKQMAERMDQLRQRLEMDGSPPCAIELGMRILEVTPSSSDRTHIKIETNYRTKHRKTRVPQVPPGAMHQMSGIFQQRIPQPAN